MYLEVPKYPRFLTAALGSAFMTTAIVYLMVQLVAIDDLGLTEAPPSIPIVLYKVRDEQEVIKKTPKVKPPPEVDIEPTPPPLVAVGNADAPVELTFLAPTTKKSLDISRTALTEGDPIPIIKVAPSYPNRAARQGIEGYVILSFTITETGATADASIIEAHPSGIFNSSALKAVKKFKYKPKVVDGRAQSVHNVQHRLTFELTNG